MSQVSIAVVAVVVILVYWAFRLEAKARAEKLKVTFAGREALSPEAFYVQYFKDAGVPIHIAVTVRRILGEQLGVDVTRLSAEDSFTTNLRFLFDADSMMDVEIILTLEEEFGIKIEDAEAESTRTIRELVELVARKTVHA